MTAGRGVGGPLLVALGLGLISGVVATALGATPAAAVVLGVVAGVVVATVAWTFVAVRSRTGAAELAARENAIRRDGILGRGIVLAVSPTGRHRGDRDETEVRLEVQLPMRRRFQVRRRDWLDADERRRLSVGAAIPVAADPNEPGHVVLVLDIPEVDPAAIAGLGPVAGGPGGPPRLDRSVRPTREEREPDR